jgi:hypothetical protein
MCLPFQLVGSNPGQMGLPFRYQAAIQLDCASLSKYQAPVLV